jgi:hypothetical protein
MGDSGDSPCLPTRCPARRIITRVIVFLLLFLAGGAIVNVAVAWGSATYAKMKVFQEASARQASLIPSLATAQSGKCDWKVVRLQGSGGVRVASMLIPPVLQDTNQPEALLPPWSGDYLDAAHMSMFSMRMADGRGWPLYCMWSSSTSTVHLENPQYSFHQGIELGQSDGMKWQDVRVLPLRPIWPGFAINTLFYAVILWLLWIAPGKVRRLVRVRQHRCPACGFIIAPGTCANGLCSECGATLPWMTKAPA